MSAARKVLRYTLIVRHPDSDAPTAVLAGKPVPKWAKDLVHADDLVDGEASDDSDSTEPKGLSDLTVAELKAEVEKRNEGREDDAKIAPESQKKDDLVAALEADDKAQA